MLRLATLALLLVPSLGFAQEAEPEGANRTLIVLDKVGNEALFFDVGEDEARYGAPTGEGPHEVAVSADGRWAAVANYGGQTPGSSITILDVRTADVLRTLELDGYTRPHGIAWLDRERIVMTCETQKAVVIVDARYGHVLDAIETEQDATHMLAIAEDRRRVFTANIGSGTMSILSLDADVPKRVEHVATGAGAEGIAVAANGDVWVTNRATDTISVVDTGKAEVRAQIECAGFPIRVAFAGERALVTCPTTGELAIFDAKTQRETARIPIDVGVALPESPNFGTSPVPIGVVVDERRDLAFVACQRGGRVAVVDLESNKVTRVLHAGQGPDGMALSTEVCDRAYFELPAVLIVLKRASAEARTRVRHQNQTLGYADDDATWERVSERTTGLLRRHVENGGNPEDVVGDVTWTEFVSDGDIERTLDIFREAGMRRIRRTPPAGD